MFNDKIVLITGGTGSLGKALTKRIFAEYNPRKVIIFSRDEFKQSEMAKEFQYPQIRFILGDIRDFDRVKSVVRGSDIIIHTAALKQVPALEYNPTEAVKTNILGTMNIINACVELDDDGTKHAIFISTDKAVNPINLYGATKLTAEKLWTAANAYNRTKFSCVRYGNVIGSRGSVIPFFQKLAEDGIKELPITDKRMTRFLLTLDQAVNLIFLAVKTMKGGEVFVPLIPSANIEDIATAIVPDCTFKYIGIRAGEKLHESLVSEDMVNVKLVDNQNRITKATNIYTSDRNIRLSPIEISELLCSLVSQ